MVAKKQSGKAKGGGGPLGKSLIRNRFGNAQRAPDGSFRHTTLLNDGREYGNMMSVTQENDLEAFLNTAQLAGTEFTAERLNVSVVESSSAAKNPFLLSAVEEKKTLARQAENYAKLTIPRRPSWDESTTPEELDLLEREGFLEWRRSLAALEEEENLMLTPYERNLQVWRQLWRVVERSDVVAQIVDARNPLLFRNADIVAYVGEMARKMGHPKHNLLIVNKADLLTKAQRKIWSDYFEEHEIDHVMFSAADAKEAQKLGHESVSVIEMLALLERMVPAKAASRLQGKKPTIGLLGYPNVGKSSTINALVDRHVVSVSSTPGKTKHFQTIELEKLTLCDCPGLVFPSFATTKAELVVNGILPIDQLREWTGPVQLLCNRIPKPVFSSVYGIKVITLDCEGLETDRTPTASELASTYAIARGYRKNTQGQPDEARAARYLLKDHVGGKTLYCTPPPGSDFEFFCGETVARQLQKSANGREKHLQCSADGASVTRESASSFLEDSSAIDTEFFGQAMVLEPENKAQINGSVPLQSAGYKGTKYLGSATLPVNQLEGSGTREKSKHHNKRNKHQKQRTKWVDQ